MVHVHLIHGINEGLTDPAWPWEFMAHSFNRDVFAIYQPEHYWASAMPVWNHFVTNPKYGQALAKRELLFQKKDPSPIYIVAHSNGTNIAMHLIRELADQGFKIEKFILFGSTIHADVEESGLADLPVKQCIAYCSPRDIVAKYLDVVPKFYGSLGAEGFKRNGKQTGVRLKEFTPISSDQWTNEKQKFITRWFTDLGHSDYFNDKMSDITFDCLIEDLGLTSKKEHVI